MGLNGIDAQIMIHRTADYSKDVGANARRAELMQEFAASAKKAEDEAKTRTVTRQENADKVQISRERQGSQQPRDGKKKNRSNNEANEEPEAQGISSGRRIDIML